LNNSKQLQNLLPKPDYKFLSSGQAGILLVNTTFVYNMGPTQSKPFWMGNRKRLT